MTTIRREDRQTGAAQRPDLSIAFDERDEQEGRRSPPAWVIRLEMAALGLALLGVTVFTQVRLSAYSATGGGAANVSAPPLIVAISLVASFGAALLLGGDDLLRALRRLRGLSWRSRWKELWRAKRIDPAKLPLSRWRGRGNWWEQISTRQYLMLLGVLGVLIVSLLTDIYTLYPPMRPFAQWLWIGSVALLFMLAWLIGPRSLPWPGFTHWRPQRWLSAVRAPLFDWAPDLLALVILTVGALALRLPNLTAIPYVVHGDEAACGLEALRWLQGGVPSLLSVGWYGLPVAGYGLPALVMLFTGPGLYGLRLSSVILGTLAVLLLYGFAREYVERRAAFFASALFAVSTIAIHFSRMGIHYIHAPVVILLTLWALTRALRTNSLISATLVGVGLSLSLQVYFSARIILLIVPVFLLGLAVFNRSALKGRLGAIGWMILSSLVAIGPLAIYFYKDQDALKSRAVEVLIYTGDPWTHQHVIGMFGTTNMTNILMRQFAAIPLIPGGLTDQSLQYGPLYPMFDTLVASLVLIGFWYALLRLSRPLCLLLVIWTVGVVTAGGALTIDMPWWPRLLAGVPAFCLLAALALDATLRLVVRAGSGVIQSWRIERMWRRYLTAAFHPEAKPVRWEGERARIIRAGALWLGALAVLVYSGGWSGYAYFHEYPTEVTATWRTQYTDIGRYLATRPQQTFVILYTDDSVIWTYSTFQFLEPQMQGERATDPATLQQEIIALLRIHTSQTHPILIVITLSQLGSFQTLLQTHGGLPPGVFAAHTGAQGQTAFYTYALE